jgi:hypothetical protein
MNHQEALDAVNAANARIDALTAQAEKSFNEIVIAIGTMDTVPQALADAIAAQAEKLGTLGVNVQGLDDLHPDATPVP